MSDLESKDGYVEFTEEKTVKETFRFFIGPPSGSSFATLVPAKWEHFCKAGWERATRCEAAIKLGEEIKGSWEKAEGVIRNQSRLLERQEPLIKAAMRWYEGPGGKEESQALSDACCAFNIATNQSMSYAELQAQVGPPPETSNKGWRISDELDAIPLGTAEKERDRAKLWMDDAARYSRNSCFWENKFVAQELAVVGLHEKLSRSEKQIRDLIDAHERELAQLRVACERDCSRQYQAGRDAAERAADHPLVDQEKLKAVVKELQGEILLIRQALIPEFADESTVAAAERTRQWVRDLSRQLEAEVFRSKERIGVLESERAAARPLVDLAKAWAGVRKVEGWMYRNVGYYAQGSRQEQFCLDRPENHDFVPVIVAFDPRTILRSPAPPAAEVDNDALVAEARKELVAKLVRGSVWASILYSGVRATIVEPYTFHNGTKGVKYTTNLESHGGSTKPVDWFLKHYEPTGIEKCSHCGAEKCEYQDHGGAPAESDLDSDPNSNSRVLIETEKKS